MTERRALISSRSPMEPRIGFSRGVRVGPFIAIAGTAPIGADGTTASPGDAGGQARRCLDIIREALADAGASLSDVIRTRVMLVHIADWESVVRVHGEYFGMIRPACTVMQVTGFIDRDWLVEIEADAIVP